METKVENIKYRNHMAAYERHYTCYESHIIPKWKQPIWPEKKHLIQSIEEMREYERARKQIYTRYVKVEEKIFKHSQQKINQEEIEMPEKSKTPEGKRVTENVFTKTTAKNLKVETQKKRRKMVIEMNHRGTQMTLPDLLNFMLAEYETSNEREQQCMDLMKEDARSMEEEEQQQEIIIEEGYEEDSDLEEEEDDDVEKTWGEKRRQSLHPQSPFAAVVHEYCSKVVEQRKRKPSMIRRTSDFVTALFQRKTTTTTQKKKEKERKEKKMESKAEKEEQVEDTLTTREEEIVTHTEEESIHDDTLNDDDEEEEEEEDTLASPVIESKEGKDTLPNLTLYETSQPDNRGIDIVGEEDVLSDSLMEDGDNLDELSSQLSDEEEEEDIVSEKDILVEEEEKQNVEEKEDNLDAFPQPANWTIAFEEFKAAYRCFTDHGVVIQRHSTTAYEVLSKMRHVLDMSHDAFNGEDILFGVLHSAMDKGLSMGNESSLKSMLQNDMFFNDMMKKIITTPQTALVARKPIKDDSMSKLQKVLFGHRKAPIYYGTSSSKRT